MDKRKQAVPESKQPYSPGDVDVNGNLATGLFVGVIVVLLVIIYAYASAA